MKRMISDPHNPGFASLIFRAGMSEFVQRKYGDSHRFVTLRRSARSLRDAGLISEEQHDDLRRQIARRVVASTLRRFRRSEPATVRAAMFRKLRELAPLGMSAFSVQTGRRGLV